jgi:hypothetical protein
VAPGLVHSGGVQALVGNSADFLGPAAFEELVAQGERFISENRAENLREVMMELLKLIPGVGPDISMADVTNIIRG